MKLIFTSVTGTWDTIWWNGSLGDKACPLQAPVTVQMSHQVAGSHWNAVTFTNYSLCVWSLFLESCKMDLSETLGPVEATKRNTENRNKSYWNLVLVIQSRNCLNASSKHGEICKNSRAKWYFKVGNERKVRWVV